MPYFTSYANHKFDILNKHKVFITKEMVEETIAAPDNIAKKGKYFFASRDGVRAVYKKEDGAIKVITFYPTKN
jgi:hypothetical protein